MSVELLKPVIGFGTSAASMGMGAMMSSRDFKENIEPAEMDTILDQVAATPIYRWNYKGDARRHIGPVTEEAPEMIVDGKILVSVDYMGFMLAAIKALNEKVKQLGG
jgi:hypothetical protein